LTSAKELRTFAGIVVQDFIFYNDLSNQQDATTFSFINLFKSALHVSGDKFSHPQKHFLTVYTAFGGDRGSTVVKVLRYKSEGRWFNPRWCQFFIDINPSDRTMALGSTQPLTEMSTGSTSWE
jgi:hypothetical protein